MAATITHKDIEPHTATQWTDNMGGDWSWGGWGEWVCTVNGSPFCRKSWENIPRNMFPMTQVR